VSSVKIQDVSTGSGGVVRDQEPFSGDLDFGGRKHGLDGKDHHMRPEAVKMLVCEKTSSKCSGCTTQDSCWRGVGSGYLKLNVSASASANNYAAEMWASCAAGNGIWKVRTSKNALENGVLKIFVDGLLYKTVHASDVEQAYKSHEVPIAKNTHVRVVFKRITTGLAAYGKILMYARGVDEYVDDCMGHKNCLVSLGDGTDSAFLFRNSNVKQLACLVASSPGDRDAVSDHCNVWATCVSSSGLTSKLKALLGAAITPHGSLAEGETNIQKLNDAEGCVDPSVEDPEAFDCECMDKMTASCGEVNEECFNGILCKNTNVCDSWKDAHCADVLLAKQNISIKAPQTKSAGLMRRDAQGAIATVDDHLDSALSGKCSQ